MILTRRKAIISGAAALAEYRRLARAQFITLGGNGGGSASFPAPVLYLPMNEGSGTTFVDGSGNSNSFTFSSGDGSWGTVTGLGSAFTFNGTTGFATGTNDTQTNFNGSVPFSASLWVYFITIPNCNLIGRFLPTTAQGYGIRMFVGNPVIYMIDATSGQLSSQAAGLSLTTSVLYHFVWTYDGSKTPSGLLFYLNSASKGLSNISNTLTGSTATGQPLQIAGMDDFGGFLANAALGRLRMFNSVLTQPQVNALYNGGTPI